MKAISLIPQTKKISLKEVEEPLVQEPDDIKIKVLQVGICGTDREEAAGGRADAPPGKEELIIGHEMFGKIVEVGSAVKKVAVGDYGLFTVRRGCGHCRPCQHNRSDMCQSGDYTERGIKGVDGFQSEFVVDKEQYIVPVPAAIKDIGVLTEPMSVVAKAVDEAMLIQYARCKTFSSNKWLQGKKALVAGIGTIGLLAAFALRLRGAEVYGMDIVDATSMRPQLLNEIGCHYIDGREIATLNLDDHFGQVDFIFEAAGIAKLQIELIDALGTNGMYVATGIPSAARSITLDGAALMQQLVLKNQVVVGSVNASIEHYNIAVADLLACKEKWPKAIQRMITQRLPFSDFRRVLQHHSADDIKVALEWS